jgi:hypothetical protein
MESIDIKSMDIANPKPIKMGPELTFKITGSIAKKECYKTMLGHGAVNIFLSELGEEELYRRWEEIFGSRVTERMLRAISFFTPLFALESFAAVPTEEIDAWFETFDLYIGESTDDNGIIIAAAQNIDSVVAKLVKELPRIKINPADEVLRW